MIGKYLEFYDQILFGYLLAAALRISHRTISNSGDLIWNFGRSRHNVSGYGSIGYMPNICLPEPDLQASVLVLLATNRTFHHSWMGVFYTPILSFSCTSTKTTGRSPGSLVTTYRRPSVETIPAAEFWVTNPPYLRSSQGSALIALWRLDAWRTCRIRVVERALLNFSFLEFYHFLLISQIQVLGLDCSTDSSLNLNRAIII